MGKLLKRAAVCLGLLTAAETGGSAYFYRRTMKRSKAKVERTIKMSGTDWDKYRPLMKERTLCWRSLTKIYISAQRMG